MLNAIKITWVVAWINIYHYLYQKAYQLFGLSTSTFILYLYLSQIFLTEVLFTDNSKTLQRQLCSAGKMKKQIRDYFWLGLNCFEVKGDMVNMELI